MNDLLFAVPWWIPTALAAIGIYLLWNGNRRQLPPQLKVGGAVLAVAIVWALLSFFVDTDKEKVERQLRQFIQNGVDANWPKFQAAMTPTVELTIRDNPRAKGSEQVTAGARSIVEIIHLRSAHIQNFQIEQTGPFIIVTCDIFTTEEYFAPTEVSSWRFEWEQSAAGWKLRELRLTALRDVPVDQLDRSLPGLR